MANAVPPKKNTAFSFEVALPSQAGAVFQSNPTLASGDVKVSKDGGAYANINSLPTAIGSGSTLTVALTNTEMNADRIVVMFHDAAGDEWCDVSCEIFTAAQTLDEVQTAIGDVPTNAELATALGTADDAVLAQVALVKAVTDQFGFNSGAVNANIVQVNEITVDGAGTEADPFGPA